MLVDKYDPTEIDYTIVDLYIWKGLKKRKIIEDKVNKNHQVFISDNLSFPFHFNS